MLADGSRHAGRRSRSGWSRGRTGTTRSSTPGSWAGPSRSTSRSGRATRRSSVARGSCCEHHDRLRPAFGSHNVRSLAHAMAAAEALGLPAIGLRGPDAPRHGRADPAGTGRPRASGPRLHALWRDAAGDGVPGPPAAGEHVERVVPQGELRRARADRRPPAQPRGGRCHADPDATAQAANAAEAAELPPFQNEPPTDFARAETREAMRQGARRGPRSARPDTIRSRSTAEEVDRDRAATRVARPEPELAGRRRDVDGRRSRTPIEAVAAARAALPAWAATAGPRPGRGPGPGGGDHADRGGSSWPPGRSSSAASPGARPTATSPRRSTSASSTPAR